MATEFWWKNPRPNLTIEHTGSENLGNCYNADYYLITTSKYRISKDQIIALKNAHLLGSGQEFRLKSKCDGTEEPAGMDDVPCVKFIDGVAQPGPAVNPYSGEPYPNHPEPYYVYEIERRTDSGD